MQNIRTNADYQIEINSLNGQLTTRNAAIATIDASITQVRNARQTYLNNVANNVINHNQNQQRAQLEGYTRQEEQLQNQRNAEVQQRDQVQNNLNTLTALWNTYQPLINSRRGEITDIMNIANTFSNTPIPTQVL